MSLRLPGEGFSRVGLWRSWERASMAWKRSSVRARPGPPIFNKLADPSLRIWPEIGRKFQKPSSVSDFNLSSLLIASTVAFALSGHPQKWQPLIYRFRPYFGLGRELGKTFRAEV